MTAATARWPFPGDSPLARARKVAQMYRAALGLANPQMRDECDRTATGYGETWAVPKLVRYTDEDWLPPAEAADLLCISVTRIRTLRHAGRLSGVKVDGEWRYKVADLMALQTQTRRRAPRLVAEADRSGYPAPQR